MKILFDNQIFALQDRGGISRYYSELILKLRKLGDKCILPPVISNNIYLDKISKKSRVYRIRNVMANGRFDFADKLPKIIKDRRRTLRYIDKIIHSPICLINYALNVLALAFTKYDIYHPTFFDPSLLKFKNKDSKLIISVYDMIDEIFMKQNTKIISNKKALIEKADQIIAISNATKDDIVRLYDIPGERISVIHLGVSFSKAELSQEKIDNDVLSKLPNSYVLHVGSRHGYKNFDKLSKAFAKISAEQPELMLICVGGGKFKPEETKSLRDLKILDKCQRYNLNDATLFQLYARAKLFVFPSLYEGFGLPLLEAFAARCPVISSNGGSLPEVGGKACEYFDPQNEESMIRAINNVLLNDGRREELIRHGQEQLKKFSWERTAIETQNVYNSVITNK